MSNENEPSRPPAAEMEMVQRLCATGRYLVLVPGDDEMRTLRAMARDLNVGPGEVAIEMLSMGLIVAGLPLGRARQPAQARRRAEAHDRGHSTGRDEALRTTNEVNGGTSCAARELMTTVARAGHCPVRGVGLACRDCWDAVQDAIKDLYQLTDIHLDPFHDKPLSVCGASEGLRSDGDPC